MKNSHQTLQTIGAEILSLNYISLVIAKCLTFGSWLVLTIIKFKV